MADATISWDIGLGSITTRNIAGIAANFFAADRACQAAIKRAVQESATRLYQQAVKLAPVRSGFLRRQLGVRFSERGFTYAVGWQEADFRRAGKSFYPLYTEFGTRKMAARPCLFPAAEEERSVFLPELSAAIQAALDRRR